MNCLSTDADPPFVGVIEVTELECLQLIKEAFGQVASRAAVDLDMLFAVAELAHRRDHRCGTGAETLLQGATLAGGHHLIDGDAALADLVTPVAGQLDNLIAGDAGEDRALQRRGDQFVVDEEKDIGGANLLDIAALDRIQP